ncbi:MAG: orotidine-5'-phosphate decarboxylase [Fidelibacterota bacterium]
MVPFNLRLLNTIKAKRSLLCVGLDMHPDLFYPQTASLDTLKKHAEKVIDATKELAVAYKPNLAFFERWGSKGFKWLEELVRQLKSDSIVIGDAKRGDIGSTAKQYAFSLFSHFNFDAVTLNPFLGSDSITPFSTNPEKGVFLLCKTSNRSANEIQTLETPEGKIFEVIAKLAVQLNHNQNIGLVVGATVPREIETVRKWAPDLPLLIPGIGHQGGNLEKVIKAGYRGGSALINISRSISFAGDLSKAAIHSTALDYVLKMRRFIDES